MPAPPSIVFRSAQLLPGAWRHFAAKGPVRAFNPGLLRDGSGWLLAYRVVAADGRRRIAMCRLDKEWKVVADSAYPLSDRIRFSPSAGYPMVAMEWFADPRLYRFGNRLFVYWNSGWHDPRNHQFLQELDPVTLAPMGIAREMVLHGDRQKLEKNWTPFVDAAGALRAVYSITPHRILGFTLDGGAEIEFEEVARRDWSIDGYPANHGGLRGGAPPFRCEGQYWSFCHSVHDGADGYCYAAAVYAFDPAFPYSPLRGPVTPLSAGLAGRLDRQFSRLNPAVDRVIYPCGAAHDGTRWIVSHGINDEQCALSFLDHAEVLDTLRAV